MKFLLVVLACGALPGVSHGSEVPQVMAAAAIPDAAGWKFNELRRVPAAEAQQGVVADGEYFYAIANHAIGKYRISSGARVAGWQGAEEGPIHHLNAGIVYQGRLYCAHSNYPGVPMFSSVEIWDITTMQHVGNHSFGLSDGSLTWVERRNGRWLACFVHYGAKGGVPGRGPEWTHVNEYDDDWRQTGGWMFPAELIARLSGRGYSCSGGALGPDQQLFVTGHDNPELYVLSFPDAGATLKWTATIPVPAQGQAFGWDPNGSGMIFMLIRKTHEIVVGRVTH